MTNWFEKLVRLSPSLALFVGRSLLLIIYMFLAPIEGLYNVAKELLKSLKRISAGFAKPFRGFGEEWKAVRSEVEYLEDK